MASILYPKRSTSTASASIKSTPSSRGRVLSTSDAQNYPPTFDARIRVRRNPKNPNKLEKIFGYNAIFTTSIEPLLDLEPPVACITISGNAEEGNQFIPLKEQISRHKPQTRIDLADAKFDELHNYEYTRKMGSIPLIDYNPRNEDLSLDALRVRGYDRNGWPFAPCGVLCRPNGFDPNCQRATFTCKRQCVSSNEPTPKRILPKLPLFHKLQRLQ